MRLAASPFIIIPALVFVPVVAPLPLPLVADVVGLPPGGSQPRVAAQLPLVPVVARMRSWPKLSLRPPSFRWLAVSTCMRPCYWG